MARLARLYVPRIPQLIQADFAHPLAPGHDTRSAPELDLLLTWLRTESRDNQVSVHGWLLLNDRLALLATPSAAASLPRLIQGLGRRYAARLRHGSVFAGRYRSALIEPGRWLLPALIWLESLPARLGYVELPHQWPWSSAAWHTGVDMTHGTWATDHADYWAAGNTPFARQAAYRVDLRDGLTAEQNRRISQALFGQWALGDADFLAQLAHTANRRIAPAARGRPRTGVITTRL